MENPGEVLSPEQFTRRVRRESVQRKAWLDQRAVELDRRKQKGRGQAKTSGHPISPTAPSNVQGLYPSSGQSEGEGPILAVGGKKCGLEELVLCGALGRKVEEACGARKRAERWRRACETDEQAPAPILRASRQLEAFLESVGVDAAKALSALVLPDAETSPTKKKAFLGGLFGGGGGSQQQQQQKSPAPEPERVTLEQLSDAIETVEEPAARAVVVLCLAPSCRLERHEFAAGVLPPLPRPAACAAASILELVCCAGRIEGLDLAADAAAARAACAAARLEALVAFTDTTDIDALRAQLAAASDAKLALDRLASAAHAVAHTGLLAETLVQALAQALRRPDLVDALLPDDEVVNAKEAKPDLVKKAANWCAGRVETVAKRARLALHRVLHAAKVAKTATEYAKKTLALALDENDQDDLQDQKRAQDWRNELDAMARANFQAFSDAVKATPDQRAFDHMASSKRVALTLAHAKLVRGGGGGASKDSSPKPSLTEDPSRGGSSTTTKLPSTPNSAKKTTRIGTKAILAA